MKNTYFRHILVKDRMKMDEICMEEKRERYFAISIAKLIKPSKNS